MFGSFKKKGRGEKKSLNVLNEMFRYNIKVIAISGHIWVYHATLNYRVRGRKYEDRSPELYFSVTIRNMTASTADHHRYDAQKVGCICMSCLVLQDLWIVENKETSWPRVPKWNTSRQQSHSPGPGPRAFSWAQSPSWFW